MRKALGRGLTAPRASNVVDKLAGITPEPSPLLVGGMPEDKIPKPWMDEYENIAFEVVITDPISVNKMYGTNFKTGRRFISKDGEAYAGKEKETKSRGYEFIPGRLHDCFLEGGLPQFPEGRKVVVSAYATWASTPRRVRDMSNLQKPVEDAMQKGGFIKNDCYLLWRNMDFVFGERNELRLMVRVMTHDGTVEKN